MKTYTIKPVKFRKINDGLWWTESPADFEISKLLDTNEYYVWKDGFLVEGVSKTLNDAKDVVKSEYMKVALEYLEEVE